MEVFQLPPYWSELRASERFKHYICIKVILSFYFDTAKSHSEALGKTFETVYKKQPHIDSLVAPFRGANFELLMCVYTDKKLNPSRRQLIECHPYCVDISNIS